MSLKSPWIFRRSPWIFLKAPCIQITFILKKCFPQRNDWKHNNTQKFFQWSWKCFLYMILVFLAQFIFHYLKNPRNCEERYCNKQTPLPPPTHFKGLYFMLLGKKIPWKMILVLENSLSFSQKILYEPRTQSQHAFFTPSSPLNLQFLMLVPSTPQSLLFFRNKLKWLAKEKQQMK